MTETATYSLFPPAPVRAETAAPASRFTLDALERHKRAGLELAVRARAIAMIAVAILVLIITPFPQSLYYVAICGVFMAVGFAQRRIGQVGTSRRELFLIFVDLALLTAVAIVPNPLDDRVWPLAFQYQFQTFIFFFIVLALGTLAYSWRTIFAIGTWTSGLWLLGAVWVELVGQTDPDLARRAAEAFAGQPAMIEALDPNNVRWPVRAQEVVCLLLVAAILSVAVRRSNDLLLEQAATERARTNLSRYFSPNVVEELAGKDEPLAQVTEQEVAVLFVDIVDFTPYAAAHPGEEVIATLRSFHALMEREVFALGGTLDKYLGDGLMATFGTPFAGPTDASDALAAARAMDRAAREWNESRRAAGRPELRASFGLHYGPVVLGDIGANRLEFAVIGNTVNVASRLEALSRELDARIIASDSLIRHAERETSGAESPTAGFGQRNNVPVRGLDVTISVWTFPTPD